MGLDEYITNSIISDIRKQLILKQPFLINLNVKSQSIPIINEDKDIYKIITKNLEYKKTKNDFISEIFDNPKLNIIRFKYARFSLYNLIRQFISSKHTSLLSMSRSKVDEEKLVRQIKITNTFDTEYRNMTKEIADEGLEPIIMFEAFLHILFQENYNKKVLQFYIRDYFESSGITIYDDIKEQLNNNIDSLNDTSILLIQTRHIEYNNISIKKNTRHIYYF